jgi:hypothetical protein
LLAVARGIANAITNNTAGLKSGESQASLFLDYDPLDSSDGRKAARQQAITNTLKFVANTTMDGESQFDSLTLTELWKITKNFFFFFF